MSGNLNILTNEVNSVAVNITDSNGGVVGTMYGSGGQVVITNFAGGGSGSTGPTGPSGVLTTESIGGTGALNPDINVSYVTGTIHSLANATIEGFTKTIVNNNNNVFNSLEQGVNNQVNMVRLDSNNNIYAGGTFTLAGSTETTSIAKWVPSGLTGTWYPLGSGLGTNTSTGDCNAIAIDSNDNVYAGGGFTVAGGSSANRIAKWVPSGNTGTWFPLGTGLNNTVNMIAIDSNDDVYAGGIFTTAGGSSALNIAKWVPSGNTGTWFPLGTGLGSTVISIAIDSNDNVYAGGIFTTAGGSSANRIAKWTPSGNTGTWFPLQTGLDGTCVAISVDSNDNIYTLGNFNRANNIPSFSLAKWTPSGDTGSWSNFPNTFFATPFFSNNSTLIINNNLYIPGITTLNDLQYGALAKYDITNNIWSPVYTNRPSIFTIAGSTGVANTLYIGGSFTIPRRIASVNLDNITTITGNFINQNGADCSNIQITNKGTAVSITWNSALGKWVPNNIDQPDTNMTMY